MPSTSCRIQTTLMSFNKAMVHRLHCPRKSNRDRNNKKDDSLIATQTSSMLTTELRSVYLFLFENCSL